MRVTGDFVTAHWPVISNYFAEMIETEEGTKPSISRLNVLLANFQTGAAVLWTAVDNNKMIAFFVTSTYFGGPSQAKVLYLTYLRGIHRIPSVVMKQAVSSLSHYANSLGCTMLHATVKDERLKSLAENLGAEVDFRVTWRI